MRLFYIDLNNSSNKLQKSSLLRYCMAIPLYGGRLKILKLYDKDKIVEANLRKAPKLTYSVLHPSNSKQNVHLAIALFHEMTVAAFENYLPERSDASEFLKMFLCWWMISNAKQRYTHNKLSNAIIAGDGKTSFYLKLADWIESWSTISDFCFSKQTANALSYFNLTLSSLAHRRTSIGRGDSSHFPHIYNSTKTGGAGIVCSSVMVVPHMTFMHSEYP